MKKLLLITLLAFQKPLAEAPPQNGSCDWMYDKAYLYAILAEKANSDRPNKYQGYGTDTSSYLNVPAQMSSMWSSMYIACREHKK